MEERQFKVCVKRTEYVYLNVTAATGNDAEAKAVNIVQQSSDGDLNAAGELVVSIVDDETDPWEGDGWWPLNDEGEPTA